MKELEQQKKYLLPFFLGAIWFSAGCFLLFRGASLINPLFQTKTYTPFLSLFEPLALSTSVMLFIIVIFSLLIGLLKARFVLAKLAKKNCLALVEGKKSTKQLLLKTAIFIVAMMGLGFLIRFLGTPDDIRAVICLSVGFALVQGSRTYLQFAKN